MILIKRTAQSESHSVQVSPSEGVRFWSAVFFADVATKITPTSNWLGGYDQRRLNSAGNSVRLNSIGVQVSKYRFSHGNQKDHRTVFPQVDGSNNKVFQSLERL